jgi:polynucleotide 5'-hydroxyl-kinase GRC3/NOL9
MVISIFQLASATGFCAVMGPIIALPGLPASPRGRLAGGLLLPATCAILPAVDDIIVSPQWQQLAVEELRGTILIIGASDSGKSTLARYVFHRLAHSGTTTAYLDADMGQSSLWLPTTLNIAMAEAGDARFPPRGNRASFFVGSTTPRGHMLPTVVGNHRLQQKALSWGAQAIVVDSTGLVDPSQGGKALKQWKIELLAPAMVIGLQRRQELEPILWPLRRDGRVQTAELRISPHARERSREARVEHRRRRLARYFGAAKPLALNVREMPVYDVEQMAPEALLAFQDSEGLILELGVVDQVDGRSGTVTVHSPLSSPAQAASIRFGHARWSQKNQQERGPV